METVDVAGHQRIIFCEEECGGVSVFLFQLQLISRVIYAVCGIVLFSHIFGRELFNLQFLKRNSQRRKLGIIQRNRQIIGNSHFPGVVLIFHGVHIGAVPLQRKNSER